ncbi:hypothetical protein PTSG_00546 [Salpingoeca rosetta]|uniref:Thioredoxin domain-containing protein n=1 Tax=Salpingoeca rosetta (strain ATCC 50818 / BSB-021) TaxID=946362 RepID=F2TWS7_SALR5|nr:uncharacterized protein PTSG_00546 [Salpingoeca rosetta]EGD72523.1 hypothetical protein PTSG_00546 [Salpingoeca rosetta]|eukprot:XP_004999092.1 hypothetical protein PTSG_00546 [Salpingoeca rosetta]
MTSPTQDDDNSNMQRAGARKEKVEEEEEEEEEERRSEEDVVGHVKALLQRCDLPGVTALLNETIQFAFGTDEVTQDTALHLNGHISSSQQAQLESIAHGVMELGMNVLPMISIGAAPGDLCPHAEVTDLANGNQLTLDAVIGSKVALLDVWATWCEPSLEALGEYDKLLSEHESWEDSVCIATASLDDTPSEATATIAKMACERPRHLWLGREACDTYLSLSSLPAWFLFKEGRIVWRGHPASIDLDASITSLLSGGDVVEVESDEARIGDVEGLPNVENLSDEDMLEFCQALQEKTAALSLPEDSVSCCVENSIVISSTDTKKTRRVILTGPKQFEPACADLATFIRSKIAGNVLISFAD